MNELQGTVDNILALSSTLEKLGKDLLDAHVHQLEAFYTDTALSSEAAVHRATALKALVSYDQEIKEEFPAIAELIINCTYDLEADFHKKHPSYTDARKRMMALVDVVPDHAQLHLTEMERKFKETMAETKKKVTNFTFNYVVGSFASERPTDMSAFMKSHASTMIACIHNNI